MKQNAGQRPFWSTISATERMLTKPSGWQKAYMRLSAFAPIAYGAKGLMYYCYDRFDGQVVLRDLDYRTSTGWNPSIYYDLPDNSKIQGIFFGLFSSVNDTGRRKTVFSFAYSLLICTFASLKCFKDIIKA